MKALRVRIHKSAADGKWYFAIVSGNNEIIGQGQGYKRMDSLLKTIARMKNGMAAAIVEMEG